MLFLMAHFVRLIELRATKNYSADAGFQNFVTGNELNKNQGLDVLRFNYVNLFDYTKLDKVGGNVVGF